MTERKLGNGAYVRVRPIPVHVYKMNRALTQAQIGEAPALPMLGVKSIAGHVENVQTAPADSPEYAAWLQDYNAWDARRRAAEERGEERWEMTVFDYGVQDWRWDTEAPWVSEPPDDWEFPQTLVDHGIQSAGSRRLDYILVELLTNINDYNEVIRLALQESSTDLTDEEVVAAGAGFRPADTRGAAGSDLAAHDVRRGDGRGGNLGRAARRLVRAITGRQGRDGGEVQA